MKQREQDRQSDEYPASEVCAKLLLTIPEVAQRLSLGRSFVYQLVMKGEISSIKIGRARRVPKHSLDCFIEAQMKKNIEDSQTSFH